MSEIQNVPISKIRAGQQVRVEMCRDHVDQIAALFDPDNPVWPDGLPAIDVFTETEEVYLIGDGHHRHDGAMEGGCELLLCNVHRGGAKEATLFACGANAENGLRRTAEDRKNAILTAYGVDPQLSNRAIAKICRVDEKMVRWHLAEHRKTLSATAEIPQSESDCLALAETRQANAPVMSTAEIPQSEGEPAPSTAPAPDVRVDARGRRMNVAKIGKGRKTDGPAPSTGPAPDAAPSVEEAAPEAVDAPADPMVSLALYRELDGVLRQAATLLSKIAKVPGGELLRDHYLKVHGGTRDGQRVERHRSLDLDNLRAAIERHRPYAAPCPICRGRENPHCKVCYGLNWTTKHAWNNCSDQQRAGLTAPAA